MSLLGGLLSDKWSEKLGTMMGSPDWQYLAARGGGMNPGQATQQKQKYMDMLGEKKRQTESDAWNQQVKDRQVSEWGVQDKQRAAATAAQEKKGIFEKQMLPHLLGGDQQEMVQSLFASGIPEYQKMAMSMLGQGSDATSKMKEYERYKSLSPEDRKVWDDSQRGSQYLNTGQSYVNPRGGAPIPIQPKQSELPQFKRKVSKNVAMGSVEGAKEAGSAKVKESAVDVMTLIEDIQGGDYKGIYGAVDGLTPNWMPGKRDANAKIERLTNMLTLAARGALKGQGTITDTETAMLDKAESLLRDRTISDDVAAKELDRILKHFKDKMGGGNTSGDSTGWTVRELP